MPIILDKVSYTYAQGTAFESRALKEISLTIRDGDFIGMIGHTGSGKSTLIQHLNGLLKPDSGSIYYNGRDISDDDFNRREFRTKVGLVFQYPEYQLFETDIFKDVCFGPKNQGMDKKKAELRAFDALRKVGIPEEMFYQSPFELSGGQKRRVAIAGILAMDPEVLILDEPTAGLDPKGKEDILNLIAELHRSREMTIILVSHSMEDVAEYVNRLIVLREGEIALDGTPGEVFAHEEELRSMGLSAPEVTYCMQELKKRGIPIAGEVTTLAQAKEQLLKLWKDRKNHL